MNRKQRILRFITYYRCIPSRERGKVRKLICEACEFKGGTFDYKVKHLNYFEWQLNAIERIIQDHKDGKIEML